MSATVFGVLKGRIAEDITSTKDHLAGGAAKDFAEYRQAVGAINGLRKAAAHVAELERAHMLGEDDLDD